MANAPGNGAQRPWIMQYEFPSYDDAKAFQEMLRESGHEALSSRAILRQRHDYFKPEEFPKWPVTIAMRQALSGNSFDKELLAIAMQEGGWGGTKNGVSSWLKRAIELGIVTRLERGLFEFTRRPKSDTACMRCTPEPLSCTAP